MFPAQVKLLNSLDSLDEESFAVHFSERMWTVTLSNGTVAELVPDEGNKPLFYEDRLRYGKLAKEHRMAECDNQVRSP